MCYEVPDAPTPRKNMLTKINRLGVKTRIFHLGDYRRATIPFGEDMPDDYFYVNGKGIHAQPEFQ